MTACAAPIVKWVGGKTRLIDELLERAPTSFGCYYEPFAGGAALFFRLSPVLAVLNDANADLMAMYRALANTPESVIYRLQQHAAQHAAAGDHADAYYYGVRDAWNRGIGIDTERAAAFIYLNKTCFNGLWRVNRAGKFNAPFGDYDNPTICDDASLRAAAAVLARVDLRSGDYRDAVADAQAGDFVYFDPPYHDTFTSYTSTAFGPWRQRELAATVADLAARGVRVLLSNSDTPLVRELYREHRIDTVLCSRAINSKGDARGEVHEVIVSAGRTENASMTLGTDLGDVTAAGG